MSANDEKRNLERKEEMEKEMKPLDEREIGVWNAMQEAFAEEFKHHPQVQRSTLIRFIRGYATEEKPTEAAIERMTKALEWRRSYGAAKYRTTALDNEQMFREIWPVGVHGVSKDGRPVYYERLGQIDPPTLEANFDTEAVMKHHVKVMEKVLYLKEKLIQMDRRMIYKHVVVIDLTGFGWKHMGKKFYGPVKEMMHVDQHYYPEMLNRMIICNAPFYFKGLWAVVKPWVHPLTRARIKMGTKYLREYIDDDQIPQFLGGSCQCAEGKCLFVPFQDGRSDTQTIDLEQKDDDYDDGMPVTGEPADQTLEVTLKKRAEWVRPPADSDDSAPSAPAEEAS